MIIRKMYNRTSEVLAVLLGMSCLLIVTCVPPEEPEPKSIDYTLDDPVCRQIVDYQDRQLADSLYSFLRHENPTYRWLAARAFSSIRTEDAVDSLVPLLRDSWTEIRSQAAFALGQTKSESAEEPLIRAFEQNDSLGQYTGSNAAILEAVGKCGSKRSLQQLTSIQTYLPSDTLLLLGQARGIYRFMLRGMTDSAGTAQMARWLTQSIYPRSVRLLAADYLKRAENIDLDGQVYGLRRTYRNGGDAELCSVLAYLLAKSGDRSALREYKKRWDEQASVNERSNIISGCTAFLPYEACKEFVKDALRDPNPSVRLLAANFFLKKGSEDDASEYREWALDDTYPTQVRLSLYRAALRHLPFYYALTKASIRGSLRSVLQQTGDPYHRAQALMALSEEWDYRSDILDYTNEELPPPVRTGAVRAYENAYEQSGRLSVGQQRSWQLQMQEFLLSEDPGMSYEAADALLQREEQLETGRLDIEKIKQRKSRCTLPASIETYNKIGALIAAIEGIPYSNRVPEHTHPIDWRTVRSCTDSTLLRFHIGENHCDIRLFPEKAPGSVANFVQLVQDGFYDGKVIHRVVPDFVIQDGCPRGDGFGSLDYTIRSETPPVYYDRAGRLGMASAGPHTECTQWFITHRPTPHLDGRYTIFGQVVSGMDRMYDVSVGDTIRSIELINLDKK